jgi:hypothetical protein
MKVRKKHYWLERTLADNDLITSPTTLFGYHEKPQQRVRAYGIKGKKFRKIIKILSKLWEEKLRSNVSAVFDWNSYQAV